MSEKITITPVEPGAETFELVEKPEEKQLTEGEIRKLRKLYVTVKHPRVAGCGHRLNLHKQPRHRNCQTCWFAWLNNNGKVVQQLDEMHTKGEDAIIVALQGVKFFHRFLQFMSTIAQWKLAQEAQNELDGSNQEDSAIQPTAD